MTKNYQTKSCLIIGYDDITDILDKFSNDKIIEPYIKYYYKDKGKIKDLKIKVYEEIYKHTDSFSDKENILNFINSLKSMSDDYFYEYITFDCTYDSDKNAISIINPNGKFESYKTEDLLLTNENKLVNKLFLSEWNNNLPLETINTLNNLWAFFVEKKEPHESIINVIENFNNSDEYFKNFENINQYLDIHRQKFDSIIIDGEWIDFNIYTIEDSIQFYNIINKINKNTLIQSINYFI